MSKVFLLRFVFWSIYLPESSKRSKASDSIENSENGSQLKRDNYNIYYLCLNIKKKFFNHFGFFSKNFLPDTEDNRDEEEDDTCSLHPVSLVGHAVLVKLNIEKY